MKRILVLLLIASMLISVVGCRKDNKDTNAVASDKGTTSSITVDKKILVDGQEYTIVVEVEQHD